MHSGPKTLTSRPWSVLVYASLLSCIGFALGPVAYQAQEQNGLEARLESARDLGPIRFLRIIRGRDVGFSARFANRSVWVFGDTPLNSAGIDGYRWRSSTWAWISDFDAHDGLGVFHEPVDRNGTPREFLPFTDEELSYNSKHNQLDLPEAERSRWALWPGPLVVDSATGKAFVFYAKVFSRATGPFDFESVGESIALWERPERSPLRSQLRTRAGETTLLFPKGDAPLGSGALRAGDWLYSYGCQQQGMTFACIVGRARFAEVLKREAWRFFAGNDHWSEDWHAAVTVMSAAPMLSVHWNNRLGRFLAVYSTPLVNTIEIRTAPRPEGPWSTGRV